VQLISRIANQFSLQLAFTHNAYQTVLQLGSVSLTSDYYLFQHQIFTVQFNKLNASITNTVPSLWGSLVGLAPQTKLQASPN